ncbi:MAG: patatin-like phospholipase family protein [Clostridia bacterium]
MAKDLSKKVAGKKLGLALGGGAARGAAHLGALKAFKEYNISFDFIAGTSVGSIIGACLAAGLDWEEMKRAVDKLELPDLLKWKKWEIGYDSSAIADFLETLIGKKDFEKLKVPFAAVATDVKYAKERIFKQGSVSKAVQASCTVPGIFVPVKEDGTVLVDGGVVNNVPANVVRDMGAEIVFAIDLNGELPEVELEGKLIETLYAVFNIMVRNNSQLGYHNSDHVIIPKLEEYPFHKLDEADEMFELGYKATKEKLEEFN